MPVTYFDIDDQFNKKNIEAAKKAYEEQKNWDKQYGNEYRGYKYLDALPEDDEEGIEEI